jgi:hypothetical protein
VYTDSLYLIPNAPSLGANVNAPLYPNWSNPVTMRGPSGPAILVMGVHVQVPFELYNRDDITVEINGSHVKVPGGGSGSVGMSGFTALTIPLALGENEPIVMRASVNGMAGFVNVTLQVTNQADVVW